jgi:hypothetical protein
MTNLPQPWYRRLRVGIEVGPTGANSQDAVYMANASGQEIIANLVRAQAEYAVIFMKDHKFAYYNSRVATKAPNLGERDLLAECLAEAEQVGLPLIAYCQVQYDTSSWEAHPEWRMHDAEGKEIRGRLCYNSGYVEFIKQLLAELMDYPIAGFHIDMLDFGFQAPYGCWCPQCQRQFRATYDQELPRGLTWDEAWDKMLQFRYDSNTRFCQELQTFVRSSRPELSVDFNYHGYPPFSWEAGQRPVQHARNGDFVTAEGLPWVFGYNNPSLLALFLQATRPEEPFQGVASRSVYNYHDFTVRPVADMKWETFTYLAYGGMCTFVDKANYEGTLDPLVYARLGEVFGEARQHRADFGHTPLPEVGLYYSSRTRDWYARTEQPKYFAAVSGAHHALVQSHIPLGMVMDETVSLAALRRYPVLYVPNAAILSPAEIALFADYAQAGGKLLFTGLSGLCDRYGQLQAHSALTDLIGAQLVGCITDHPDNYIRLPATLAAGPGRFLLEAIPPDWPFLTWGPLARYEPTTAQAYGELLTAHRSEAKDNLWRQLMSPHAVVGPAVLINQVGQGQVICVPCLPDAAWIGNYRVPEHRNLIRNLVRYLHPNPPLQVDAPRNVEIVLTRDASRGRLLLHFLCCNSPPTSAAFSFPEGRRVLPSLIETAAPYRASVLINRPFARVEAAHASAQVRPGQQRIDLEIDDIYAVLSIYES